MNEAVLGIDATILALRAHIAKCVPALGEILSEFPAGNNELIFPALSITHADPELTNEMPYELCVCPPSGALVAGKIAWVVGQWDVKFQLDLWARSVFERDELALKLFKALNPRVNPMGLFLPMENYYNLQANLTTDGFAHMDEELGAQKGEWRTKFSVLVTVKQVLETQESFITKPIVIQLDILDTVQDIDP